MQHEQGHLPQASMDAVAAYLGLPPIQVYEVASFYSMFETKPAGRVHVSVCTNISCMLCGADEIVAAARAWLVATSDEELLALQPRYLPPAPAPAAPAPA